MDIGSAKITSREMDGISHHLIDVLDPREEFNVVRFQTMAKKAMEEIYDRGHIPIVTGGTGFYIQALLYDVDFKENDGSSEIRQKLEQLCEEKGKEYLHHILQEIDPESARQIHANNRKRVIRAIEYYQMTGQPISQHNQTEREKTSPYGFSYFVLNCDRGLLYQKIDQRVDEMMAAGLVEEVKNLQKMGCHRGMVSMQGLGYKEILDYLDGRYDLEEAVRVLKRDTRHFAKRQITWFKRERDVRWVNLEEFAFDSSKILAHILQEWKGIFDNGTGTNV